MILSLILVHFFRLQGTLTAWALKIGDELPQKHLQLKNVDGNQMSLSDLITDKGLLVTFSSNVCPKVKAWDGRLRALGPEFIPRGIAFVAINSNDVNAVPGDSFEAMKKKSYPFPYLKDEYGALADAFSAQVTPEVFLFDSKNKLVYHGAIDNNPFDLGSVTKRPLRDALEAVLKKQTVKVTESPASGTPITRPLARKIPKKRG